MKFIKIFLYLLVSVFVAITLFFVFVQTTDYNPSESEIIFSGNDASHQISVDSSLTIASWNIGYAGLGNDMDFFYDGGTKVKTTQLRTELNLNRIIDFISNNDTVDFFFIQEIDIHSKRTYRLNEFDSIVKRISCNGYFSKNYDASFVPMPLPDPMGKVVSGIATLSKIVPAQVIRYSFTNMNQWPTKLFLLDRCFSKSEYNLSNGKKLVLINTHNEAFDDGGIRRNQFRKLMGFAEHEFEKGNYVVVGGDWNTCPPDFNPEFENFDSTYILKTDSLKQGWQYVFDKKNPTNRSLLKSYSKDSKVTVIDYFITSPNVKNISVKTINLGFENSDHNPVVAKIQLKRLN